MLLTQRQAETVWSSNTNLLVISQSQGGQTTALQLSAELHAQFSIQMHLSYLGYARVSKTPTKGWKE